jgi:hypothetical protein
MDSEATSHADNILRLIGALVLTSQEVERLLKAVLPYANSKDTSVGAALQRHSELKRKPLGELVGLLLKYSSVAHDFRRDMEDLVDRRNRLVHHFEETYGPLLAEGRHEDVVSALERQLADLRGFRSAAREMALFVLEALRDVTFRDRPEYGEIAAACASIRQRVAS